MVVIYIMFVVPSYAMQELLSLISIFSSKIFNHDMIFHDLSYPVSSLIMQARTSNLLNIIDIWCETIFLHHQQFKELVNDNTNM